MFSVRGSLDGIGLAALRKLIASVERSGCLYVWCGASTARIYFEAGQLVAAALDREDEHVSGLDWRSAHKREFAFTEGEELHEPISAAATREVMHFLEQLGPQPIRPELVKRAPEPLRSEPVKAIFSAVPFHQPITANDDLSAKVEVSLHTLKVLTAIDGQRTIAELAEGYDLAETLRELARLVDLGLVGVGATTPALPARAPHQMQPAAARAAVRRRARCPMLGLVDDPETAADGPSLLHRCFASGLAETVTSHEQADVCFSETFSYCPRLRPALQLPDPAPSGHDEYPSRVEVGASGVRRLISALGFKVG